jgi:hypothetical protein
MHSIAWSLRSVQRIEVAWFNQPGRHQGRTGSLADGFKGGDAIAGLAVVAHGPPELQTRVRSLADTLRDTFAEGVAYGAGELLGDCIGEILEGTSGEGISFAAAAVLDREVWTYSAGTCRAFLTGSSCSGLSIDSEELPPGTVIRRSLQPGQAVVLVTEGLERLVCSAAADSHTSRCRVPLANCLRNMVEETRIRFRKTGGGIAAVRLCRVSRKIPSIAPRLPVYLLLVLLAVLAAAFVICDDDHTDGTGLQRAAADTSETVMPLD